MEENQTEEKQAQMSRQKGNAMIWIAIVIIVVIIGIVYYSRGKKPSSLYPASNSQTQNSAQQNSVATPAPSSEPAVSQADATAVTIQNFAFSPASLTIKKGETVTWTNKDSTAHTVTSDNNVFSSNPLNNGQTFSFTFNNAGTFPYHCNIHPMMKATITVQ